MRARFRKFWLVCGLLVGLFAVEDVHAQGASPAAAVPVSKAQSGAPQAAPAQGKGAAAKKQAPDVYQSAAKNLDALDADTVEAAILALAESSDPRAGKAVAQRVKRGLPPQLIEGSIDTLVKLKAVHAAPMLLELAQHRRWQIRTRALSALAELRVKSAQSTLLYALDDPSAEVRAAAATGLSLIGDGRALNSLRLAFDRGVDGSALALAKLGGAKECELLIAQAKAKDFASAHDALLLLLTRREVSEANKRALLTAARDVGTENATAFLAEARATLVNAKDTHLLGVLDQLTPTATNYKPAKPEVVATRAGAK